MAHRYNPFQVGDYVMHIGYDIVRKMGLHNYGRCPYINTNTGYRIITVEDASVTVEGISWTFHCDEFKQDVDPLKVYVEFFD